MEPGQIAIRCVIAYAFLLVMMRLKGKRAVGEATPFDFVLALILGDMIDDLFWAEVAVTKFIVGVGTLVVVDVLATIATYHSRAMRQWLEGLPRIVMANGTIRGDELRGEQINPSELESMLRQKGFGRERYKEIRKAVLEVNADLSVVQHDWAEPVQKSDAEKVKRAKAHSR